ncbi:hypothetical protein CC79DRAFT_1373390 [Sarocladium strictum]
MPIMYRAPETLLYIQWSYPIDIWSVGLTNVFSAKKDDGGFADGVHLAELIAALGPPPQGLLNWNRSRALEYWDDNGNWGDFVPIPAGKTFEAVDTKLQDKTKFLNFIHRDLTWASEERPTTKALLQDPWLRE